VREQQRARVGQRDRARAAGAVDQPLPDDALECRNLLGDGRLCVAEAPRGAAERSLLRDRLEGEQMPQLNAEPTISLHNRTLR
jgi:hypothetical protein